LKVETANINKIEPKNT